MSTWRCDLCPVTGTEPNAKASQKAWDRHFYAAHYGKDTD